MKKKFYLMATVLGLALMATAIVAGNHFYSSAAAKDEAARISLEDAKKDFDDNAAIFVDTRPADAFKESHIKGAINLPAADIEARYKELPTDKKIIAYCSWPAEHTSASLVQKLNEKGIKNAFALLGGTRAWRDAGYPMEGEQK